MLNAADFTQRRACRAYAVSRFVNNRLTINSCVKPNDSVNLNTGHALPDSEKLFRESYAEHQQIHERERGLLITSQKCTVNAFHAKNAYMRNPVLEEKSGLPDLRATGLIL